MLSQNSDSKLYLLGYLVMKGSPVSFINLLLNKLLP